MTVYVDPAMWPYGRMTMCHMVADSTVELLAMAATIGVDKRWLQKRGTAREHFDVCKAKRALAIRNGAAEVSSKELVEIMKRKGD